MNAFKPYRKNYRMNIFFLQFCNLFKFYGLHNGNEIGTFPYSCLNCKSIFASFKNTLPTSMHAYRRANIQIINGLGAFFKIIAHIGFH